MRSDESIVWLMLHGASSLIITQLRHRCSPWLETQLTFSYSLSTRGDQMPAIGWEISKKPVRTGVGSGKDEGHQVIRVKSVLKPKASYSIFCSVIYGFGRDPRCGQWCWGSRGTQWVEISDVLSICVPIGSEAVTSSLSVLGVVMSVCRDGQCLLGALVLWVPPSI